MTRRELRIKRVYQPPYTEDGLRVLVDLLWPRGLSRERAQIDLWLKEIAPAMRCAAASTPSRALGKSSRPPITLNSDGRRRSLRYATCLIGCAASPSPCSSPLATRPATTQSL